MQTTTTVGLDIAKSVFQVHCVDANGEGAIGTRRDFFAAAAQHPFCQASLGLYPSPSGGCKSAGRIWLISVAIRSVNAETKHIWTPRNTSAVGHLVVVVLLCPTVRQ
jgi:hypothetical protein